MKISTKGLYAVRLMLYLAEHDGGGPVSLKEVSESLGISKKYLEQIVPILNRAKVLKTNRGYQGGYQLAQSPDHYTVGMILRLTEGSLAPVACVEQDPVDCPRSVDCPTLPLWKGLNKVINDYLDSITLQDILDQQRERYANDYVI